MTTAAPTIPGLADLPPGPEPGTLTDDALVEALQACSRLHAQAHARMLRTLLEVAARSRAVEPGWELMVIATALTWTETKAGRELDFADTLAQLLPDVFAAFDAGAIDHGKAWTFVDILGCAQLTPTQLAAICAKVLPQAPGLTTGQIRAWLLRAVLAVDPGYRERRYRRAVRERGVRGYLDPDGAGVITGSGLAADDTVAACARLDLLVEAAQRAGHPASKGQLAADVFLRLLDGRLDGQTTEQIVASLLADPDTYPAPEPQPDPEPQPEAEPAPEPPSESAPEPERESHLDPEPEPGPDPEAEAEDSEQPLSGVAGRGVEIRMGLGTAIGLDQCPGEVPGWGPVLPAVARRILARQAGGEWRFAVTDPDGYLLLAGITRRPANVSRGPTGGIVELQVPATLLAELAADPDRAGQWAPVVADLAGQHANHQRLLEQLDQHPERRYPPAALRRHIQVRDRTCVAPGCRRPASQADMDHTHDHARDGPTTSANIGPLCPRHHAMKHDGGWRLRQPEPGVFRWTSPLGQTYLTRGEPVQPPLPEPIERAPDENPAEPPDTQRDEGPIFHHTPPPKPAEPEPPPPPPAAERPERTTALLEG